MTLDEARAHIGAGVVYDPGHGAREDGEIVRVSDLYVLGGVAAMSERIHCASCGASELGCRDGDCCDDCGHEGRVMPCACRPPGHRVACPERPVTGARGGAVPVRLPRPDLTDIGVGGLLAAAWRAGA